VYVSFYGAYAVKIKFMKLYFLGILLFPFIKMSCLQKGNKEKVNNMHMQKIKLTTIAPYDLVDGVTKYDTSEQYIVFFKNIQVYIGYKFVVTPKAQPGKAIKSIRDYPNTKKAYYILNLPGDSLGYYYDSVDTIHYTTTVKMDSLRQTALVFNFHAAYPYIESHNKDTLYQALKAFGNDVYAEYFVSQQPTDEKYHDTAVYYYTHKLNHVNFSFHAGLDSLHKMKLFKVKYVSNEVYSTRAKLILPARELSISMEEIPVEGPEKIIELCERFLKERVVKKCSSVM
jgi:hypothetical protein